MYHISERCRDSVISVLHYHFTKIKNEICSGRPGSARVRASSAGGKRTRIGGGVGGQAARRREFRIDCTDSAKIIRVKRRLKEEEDRICGYTRRRTRMRERVTTNKVLLSHMRFFQPVFNLSSPT